MCVSIVKMVFYDIPEEFLQVPNPEGACLPQQTMTFVDDKVKGEWMLTGTDMWNDTHGNMIEYEPEDKPRGAAGIVREELETALDFSCYSDRGEVEELIPRVNYCTRSKRQREDDDNDGADGTNSHPEKRVNFKDTPTKASCRYSSERRSSTNRRTDKYRGMEIRNRQYQIRMKNASKHYMPRMFMMPAIPLPMPQFCFFDFMIGGTTYSCTFLFLLTP